MGKLLTSRMWQYLSAETRGGGTQNKGQGTRRRGSAGCKGQSKASTRSSTKRTHTSAKWTYFKTASIWRQTCQFRTSCLRSPGQTLVWSVTSSQVHYWTVSPDWRPSSVWHPYWQLSWTCPDDWQRTLSLQRDRQKSKQTDRHGHVKHSDTYGTQPCRIQKVAKLKHRRMTSAQHIPYGASLEIVWSFE